MNVFFTLIIVSSVAVLLFKSPAAVMPAALQGAENSLKFAVSLFCIYAIWLSVLKVLEKSKLDKSLAKGVGKITKPLFKNESEETYKAISLNLSANFLGMGGAATPMGIKAMSTIEHKKNRIMLVVINSTSIQLVPTTILSLRAEQGAALDIFIPSLIVTIITTIIGILLVKIFVK